MTDDDFYSSTDVTALGECNDIKSILKHRAVLPLGGIISCLCYLYIFHMYFIKKSPLLMRHPTTLAVYRCLFEFAFIQQYIWLPFLNSRDFYQAESLDSGNCAATSTAAVLAFISQFSLVGGEVWFFVISYDLRMAYTNPFASFKHMQIYYTFTVLGVALSTSILLMILGSTVYGPSPEGVIWIQNRRQEYEGTHPNINKFILFYLWMLGIYVYCVNAIWSLSLKLRKGFAETLSAKLSIIQRARTYVVGYSIFWGILLLLEFISYVVNKNRVSRGLVTAVAYGFSFRGLWSLGIIVYTNWADLSWEVLSPFRSSIRENSLVKDCLQEGSLLKPHLNLALRSEILYFTTQGIMFAASAAAQDNRTSQEPITSESEHSQANDPATNKKENRKSLGLDRLSMRLTLTGNIDSESSINAFAFKDKLNFGSGNNSNLQPVDSDSETPRMSMAKINQSQSIAIAEERLYDALDEAYRMGIDTLSSNIIRDMESDVSRSTFVAQDIRQHPAASSGSTVKPTTSRKSSSATTISPFHAMGSSPVTGKMSTVSEPSHSHNPSSVEMTIPNQLSSRPPLKPSSIVIQRTTISSESNDSSSSFDSRATKKWNDATDIEFNMSHDMVPDLHVPTNATVKPSSITARPARSLTPKESNSFSPFACLCNVFSLLFDNINDAAVNAASAIGNSEYDEFKFKDFNPMRFARLRTMFGFPAEEYVSSFRKTTKESFSEGRSGAFLFFSSDERFLVKSTSKADITALQRILPAYEQHCERNPNTLLTKFLGAHCITMYGQDLYFVVMANVFPATKLSERYDLKGSWVNRHRLASLKKSGGSKQRTLRRNKKEEGSAPLLFDNDIQQRITLIPSVAKALATQIAKDILFLKSQGLMDYSLLVGVKRQRFEVIKENFDPSSSMLPNDSVLGIRGSVIVDSAAFNLPRSSTISSSVGDEDNPFQKLDDGGIRAAVVEGPGTFYFGIIDVLQEWNTSKKIERFFKVNVLGVDPDGLSAIEPEVYASRFYQGAVIDFFDGIDEDVTCDGNNLMQLACSTSLNAARQMYHRSRRETAAYLSNLNDEEQALSTEAKSPSSPSANSADHDGNGHDLRHSNNGKDDKRESASSTVQYVYTDDNFRKQYMKEHRHRSMMGSFLGFTGGDSPHADLPRSRSRSSGLSRTTSTGDPGDYSI